MDYSVPEIDKLLEDGLNNIGGTYAAAKGISELWEHWEVFDDRSLKEVESAIRFLNELHNVMTHLLSEDEK